MAKLFSYIDYDRISDDVLYLGGNGRFVLKMNVILASKNKEDGTRKHFYREYSYDSKYTDKAQVVSIRRTFEYYMTLESMEDRALLTGVMIRPQDMILLINKTAEALKWYQNPNTFVTRKGKLMINQKPQPMIIGGFPERKTIKYEPIVIDWEDGSQCMGIRITLSDISFSDISLDRFCGFYYTINSMNLFQSAQMMLAFMGMPEIGTNRIEIDKAGVGEVGSDGVIIPEAKVKPRTIPKKGTSFFDKMEGRI